MDKKHCSDDYCIGKEFRRENPFCFSEGFDALSADEKEYLGLINVTVNSFEETHRCRQCDKRLFRTVFSY